MYEKRMIVPLVGSDIKVDEKYDLGNGFLIKKKEFSIETKLRTFEKEGYQYISPFKINEANESNTWLVAYYKDNNINESEIDNNIEDKIHTIITLFHIVKVTPLYPTVIILDFKEDSYWKSKMIRNMTSKFYLPEDQNKHDFTINLEDIEDVKTMLTNIIEFISEDNISANRVLRSIAFYKLAVETYYTAVRFLNYNIAMECIFTTSDKKIKEQLSERVALFLAGSNSEREKIKGKVRKIYKLRSEIVHGDSLEKPKIEKVNDLILSLENYLRLTYLEILKDKKLLNIFVSKKEVKRYFKKMAT